MAFTFSATVARPALQVRPSVLDFGCVLAGKRGRLALRLANTTKCAIGFAVEFSSGGAWEVRPAEGIVGNLPVDITVEIELASHSALASMVTVRSWWVGTDGARIPDLPETSCDVPVYAVFDRPIIRIERRVIDIGEVFPTLEYSASFNVALLNSFPTDFEFRNYSEMVEIDFDDQFTKKRAQSAQSRLPDHGVELESRAASDMAPHPNAQRKAALTFAEFTKTVPQSGYLDLEESREIAIMARFCSLGERALPFICDVAGRAYTCVLIAKVQPPKIKLLTETLDFSSDFVICKRSQSQVRVANQCGVKSSVRLEMIEGCNGVFSLEDTQLHELIDDVEFQIGCYSEIHGDYYGMLRLVISDPWQFRHIDIPLHVKALGSFFGFQKHTLGYTESLDGDFISFGDNIQVSNEKLIRRLTLANFSSESIPVDWSISNFVKGRQYVLLDVDVEDDGSVNVKIEETREANEQSPFHLVSSRTIVQSHGKTVVIVEFTPSDAGVFAGCVAARSGEFTHTVGLRARVTTVP
jgi:hypothetical protein